MTDMTKIETPPEHALAEYAIQLRAEDMDEAGRAHIRNIIFDTIGITVGAFVGNHGSGVIAEDHVLATCAVPDGVSLWSGRGRSVADQAALCNGTFAEVLDFQDVVVDPRNNGHLGVTIVPAALAVAEREGSSGADVIAAVAAGLEVAIAVLRAVGRRHRSDGRGFRTTSIAGPIGAAVACGKLIGLDKGQMLNAMGLAGACSPNGLMPSLAASNGGFGMDKDWVNGLAAQLGVNSADLAKRGMTASDRVVTGEKGIVASHAHGDPAVLVAPVGGTPNIGSVALKKFASCYGVHSAMEVAINLVTEYNLTPDSIDTVVVRCKADSAVTLAGRNISNHMAARFSLPYSVASAVVRAGNSSIFDFEEPAIFDKNVLAFMERVTLQADADLTAFHDEVGGFPGLVEIHVGDTVYRDRIDYPVGSIQRPLSWEDITAKFVEVTGDHWPDDRRRQIIETAKGMAGLSDIRDLLRLVA